MTQEQIEEFDKTVSDFMARIGMTRQHYGESVGHERSIAFTVNGMEVAVVTIEYDQEGSE